MKQEESNFVLKVFLTTSFIIATFFLIFSTGFIAVFLEVFRDFSLS